MDFKIDKPITNKNQDLLECTNFAQKIANAILTICDKNESVVLGLQGAWGSGKTSLINMIEESLNKTRKESRIEVLRFESWLTTDREDLFNEFFACIAEGLERDGKLHLAAKEIIAYGNRYIIRTNCFNRK